MIEQMELKTPNPMVDEMLQRTATEEGLILTTGGEEERLIRDISALFIADLCEQPPNCPYVEVSTEAVSIDKGMRRSDSFIHLPAVEGELPGFVLDRRDLFNMHEVTFWGGTDGHRFPKTGVCRERHQIMDTTSGKILAHDFFAEYLKNFDKKTRLRSISSVHILGDDYVRENIEEPNGSRLYLLEVAERAGAVALDRVVNGDIRELSCWSMPT